MALFARIKGVPEHAISRLVDELVKQLALEEYANR